MAHRMLFEGLAVAGSSVLFLGAAMLLCGALRSRSAAFRHLLLLGAFAGLFVLPILSLVLPTWCLPDSPLVQVDGPGGSGAARMELDAVESAVATPVQSTGGTLERAAGARGPAGLFDAAWWAGLGDYAPGSPLVAALLWALGAVAVLVVQIMRWTAAGILAETAIPVEEGRARSLADRIRWELGIGRRVSLLASETAPVSMVWGVRRPCIVLPSEHVEWPLDKTEAVLRHELAHVKRNDNLFHLIAGLACAIYWFNPLVWAAMRRLHFEREVACDDCVLEAGTAASAYARHLLEVSMKLCGPKRMRIVPAAMAHSSDVKRRLLHVLDPRTKRRPAGAGSVLVAILLVACIAVPVSAFRIWSEEAPTPPARPSQTVPPPVAPAPIVPARAPALPSAIAPAAAPPAAAALPAPPAAAPEPPTSAAAASPAAFREKRGEIGAKAIGGEGLWRIDGTIKIEDERVAVDGDMENDLKDIEVNATHVVFESGLPNGFKFDSRRGSLVIKESRGNDKLVWKARPGGGLDDVDVSFTMNGAPTKLDAERRADLKAIAEEIYETLGGRDAGTSSWTVLQGLSSLDADGLVRLEDKDALFWGTDSLDSNRAILLRGGPGRDITIVRAREGAEKTHRDVERMAREYARAGYEVDRASSWVAKDSVALARAGREMARAAAKASRANARAATEARAEARQAAQEAFKVYYDGQAGGGDDMESVLDLFQDQREEILDAMGRLTGDAREEYRETVVSSYERMISRLDDKLSDLRERDSTDPAVGRKIDLNEKLRDSLRETLADVKSR
jgi:beta-lactamase regulating signal transducer with metallopeptidase domain